jgi:hypothetical protein
MTRAVFLLTVGVLLSLTASDGLAADSKKRQKSTRSVSETKQKLPVKTPEIDIVNANPDDPPIAEPQYEQRDGEEISWQVLSSGGRPATAGDFVHSGTMGQFTVGTANSGGIGIHHGYWQDFGGSHICGDVNASGTDIPIDIDDVVYLLQYIFADGPAPIPIQAGDANCSGTDIPIDIDDVVYLLQYIFADGPPPCDPDNDGEPDC